MKKSYASNSTRLEAIASGRWSSKFCEHKTENEKRRGENANKMNDLAGKKKKNACMQFELEDCGTARTL